MPIPVACSCGAKFAAKDELAGKTVKCPKCSQPLTIAAAGSAAPAAAQQPAAGAPGQPSAAPGPKWAGDPLISKLLDEAGITVSKTGFRCPNCRTDLQPGTVLCVKCGTNLESGKKLTTQKQ